MITINQFLKGKGVDVIKEDLEIRKDKVCEYIEEYTKMVRDEQILLCSASSARYTAIEVRHVPERIDDDFKAHAEAPRVNIL